MTALDDLRAAQHMDVRLQSDDRLEMFLAELDPALPPLDLLPHSEIEIRHLGHTRGAA